MKKVLYVCFLVCICSQMVFASDFKELYENGQRFYDNSQYSSAIEEFKKALRINYLDDSARIGLVNSYLARGAYYANNQNNYEAAANDFRAALFYLKYYPDDKSKAVSASAIPTTETNLEQCMTTLNQSTMGQERYNRAVFLRKSGNLQAAGYEFLQAAEIGDNNIKKNAYMHVGEIMSVLDNNPKSAFYYQKSVALAPNNVALRLKYARVLDKLGQEDLAVREYNEILAQGSENADVLYDLEKIYTKKLAQSPNSAELNSNLGAILQKQKKFDAALTYYKAAEAIDPSNYTIRLNIGTLYQQKQDYNNALSAYNSVIAIQPNNIQANLYRAQVLADLGEREEAIKAYQKTLAIDPTSQAAKSKMFEILAETMSPAQMIQFFSQDAAVDKSTVWAMYDYAKQLHTKKKYDAAIACYNEVLKHDSSNPEVYVNLSRAFADKKDFQAALKIANSGKAKFPEESSLIEISKAINAEISSNKYDEANGYFNNSEYQKALDIYLTITPAPKDVLIAIAACYKGLDNIDKSIEYYKKAFNLDKNDSEIAYYIGVLYAEKENWTSAKIYLQSALKINPKNSSASDLLATVIEQNNVLLINKVIDMYNAKDYNGVLKLVSQILTEDNKNAYAYYYRGLVYDAQDKAAQAIEEYKKAILYNPELVISDYLIATAYDSLGQYSQAYSHYKKFVINSKENDDYKKYANTRLSDLKTYAN